ncbi:BlaI/MecI/CopY family transcriptional regulator [Yinghuangia soli]|uniref:BlaI/MecI/CopY family transcriptional regulator n=1 Tax=Yinghuangia soli TaxID=2908204 RepID=A0AA41Q8R6_9ACTN|nr:BlaI/MecI/CopY family transcriptional regulator [Yinghuangia soli]MCF2533680.1 BlaI/MecI/CopY family transcriptional regulator [Yinghuangia soli]
MVERRQEGPDGRARAQRRGPGELESAVLALLWTSGEARTATWAQEQLGGDLAYSTVVTIMSRLYDKGLLTRSRYGRSYAYRPVADEAGVAALRMRQVLDRESDRAAVLASFVSDLSDEDERTLRDLLGALADDRPGGGPGGAAYDRLGDRPGGRSGDPEG